MKCKYLNIILKRRRFWVFIFFFTKNYTNKEYYMTKFRFNKAKLSNLVWRICDR